MFSKLKHFFEDFTGDGDPEKINRKLNIFFAVFLVVLPGGVAFLFWPQLRMFEGVVGEASSSIRNEPIQPLPSGLELNPSRVELGERLFHDVRLSSDNSISCAHCHDLKTGGDDGRVRSVGIGGNVGLINSPTVFNSVFNFRQFWDGRAETLEEQVDGPVLNPLEMGSAWPDVVAKLSRDPRYVEQFSLSYPEGITPGNIRNAIAEFESSLFTPDSRFDLYLRGDDDVLSEEEKQGYSLFKNFGCIACHQGMNVGGNMFQKFGVLGDYFRDRGNITSADYGRFNVTGDEADRFVFRVPSLRNVEKTAPYFHDGSARTLEDAVDTMARYQLGRRLAPGEVRRIVLFLGTLTGTYRGEPL